MQKYEKIPTFYMKCGDFFHCLPKRSNNADNLEFTLVVLRMVIAYYLGYPLEEFVEGIIAAVRTVPGQEEVYVLAGILEFCGEVDGGGRKPFALARR